MHASLALLAKIKATSKLPHFEQTLGPTTTYGQI